MSTIQAVLMGLKLFSALITFLSDRQLLDAKGKAELADLLKAQADELSSAETIRKPCHHAMWSSKFGKV